MGRGIRAKIDDVGSGTTLEASLVDLRVGRVVGSIYGSCANDRATSARAAAMRAAAVFQRREKEG
ncbi:hypothetical protein KFK09_011919 [Dendrobium nobile]|uniref:Uncharacterized protein n=1 Tax=Dendrobium nobile TaxID=94219 RepID=A0A8T3BFX3_DENNO|nr:hypothetical protein KFK09_011919 [Dendrobium nobile]